jgi:clan AA aspartic protease (TIGR02281 family)
MFLRISSDQKCRSQIADLERQHSALEEMEKRGLADRGDYSENFTGTETALALVGALKLQVEQILWLGQELKIIHSKIDQGSAAVEAKIASQVGALEAVYREIRGAGVPLSQDKLSDAQANAEGLLKKVDESIFVLLQKRGGTYEVPVLINNAIMLDFVIDSGASDVSVPADVVMTLMRTGTLGKTDFLGTQTYTLADGSTVPSPTFRIRSLTVGNKVVENVVASVAPPQGSLLLGQSFLNRFKSWSIDDDKKVLVLER